MTVKNERGLTLIELMVVVAILAILVAITFALWQNLQPRSRFSADKGTIAALRSAISIYYAQHNGMWPAQPEKLVQPSPPVFQCTALAYAYDAATGVVAITSSNTVSDCP